MNEKELNENFKAIGQWIKYLNDSMIAMHEKLNHIIGEIEDEESLTEGTTSPEEEHISSMINRDMELSKTWQRWGSG